MEICQLLCTDHAYEELILLSYKMNYLFESLTLILFTLGHSGFGVSDITWDQHMLYEEFCLTQSNPDK